MGNAERKRRDAAAHNAAAIGTITADLSNLERVHVHNFLMQLGPGTQKRIGWDEERRISDLMTALHAEDIDGMPKPSDTTTTAITLSVRDAEWLVATAKDFSGHAGAFARGLVPAISTIADEIESFKEVARDAQEPPDQPTSAS